MSACTYKVSYFPAKGNAEIIRLALVAAGQEFEDERLDRDGWMKIKQGTPTKQMPILTVTENGKSTVYAQCARYLGRKYDLCGTTEEQMILVDEVFETVADTLKEIGKFVFEKDEKKEDEIKKNIAKQILPRLNDYIKERKAAHGKDGYIIGSKMTLADLHLYNIVDQGSGKEEIMAMLKIFPDVLAHADFVRSDPKIADWIKRMPESQI